MKVVTGLLEFLVLKIRDVFEPKQKKVQMVVLCTWAIELCLSHQQGPPATGSSSTAKNKSTATAANKKADTSSNTIDVAVVDPLTPALLYFVNAVIRNSLDCSSIVYSLLLSYNRVEEFLYY